MGKATKKKTEDLDNPKYDYIPTDADIQKTQIKQEEKPNKK